jgi:plastocyanin
MLRRASLIGLVVWLLGCAPEDTTGGTGGTGGTASHGGSPNATGGTATGGALATTGGISSTGGIQNTGGKATGGMMMMMGGFPSTGGTSNTGGTTGVSYTITIQNFAFSPSNLAVPPGATVTVVNQDSAPHSVTSESAMGNFTPGSVSGVSFDTGSFTAGQRTFAIPASAAMGTVVPYYCSVHKSTMPQGTVTIQ